MVFLAVMSSPIVEIPIERRQSSLPRVWLDESNLLTFSDDQGAVQTTDWLASFRDSGEPLESLDLLPTLHETLSTEGALCKGSILPDCERLAEGDENFGERRRRFQISDAKVDRGKNIISLDGWDLGPFKRNPVVLWVHNSWDLPLGQAMMTEVDGKALFSVCEFENYPFAQTVLDLLDRRTLRGASVGMRPKKLVWNKDRGGIDFIEHELLEWSVVPIPKNPRALVKAAAEGVDLAPLQRWCLDTLEGIGGEPGRFVTEGRLKATVDHLGWAGGVSFFDLSESQIRELPPNGLQEARVEAARLPLTKAFQDEEPEEEGGDLPCQVELSKTFSQWGAKAPWEENPQGWNSYAAAAALLPEKTDSNLVAVLTAAGLADEASALAEAVPSSSPSSSAPETQAVEPAAIEVRDLVLEFDGGNSEPEMLVDMTQVEAIVAKHVSGIGNLLTSVTGRAVIPEDPI